MLELMRSFEKMKEKKYIYHWKVFERVIILSIDIYLIIFIDKMNE